MKILFKLVKNIFFAFLLLYSINVMVSPLNVIIPISIFSILTVATLGVPGLMSLITLFFIIK